MREALASYDRAIALRPNDAGAHYDRGVLLRAAHRPEAALASYDRAVALRPDWPELHVNRGNALRDLDRLDEATESFQTAIRLRPGLAEAHANLGACLSRLGFVDEAMACFRTALRIIPAPERPRMPWLMTLNALDTITPAEIARAHRDMAAELARLSPPPRVHPPRIRAPGQPLRIGYVSPDLHTHSVAYFFEPVLSAHDPAAVATVCYHCGTLNDGTTRRLRAAAGQWRNAAVLDDDALAAQIAADRIDILVDLAGHTRGNRLAVFQRKPAPVQVTWIGYPNTTGMDTVDYRITDAIADPPGEDDRLHAETLVRLPHGFLCYRPPDGAPAVPPRPIATAEPGEVTFGSFNNLTKIGPAVIAAWSRILHRVPRSRLLLKAAGLGSPRARDRLHGEFAAQGVAPERVALLATTATRDAHLASYGQVDIALDSFPYNGTTTTCEALWMGVPVVALRGNRHAARVGASLLHRLGLDDLVAADIDGYVAIACALAADAARVVRLGTELRARMLGSPLCDAAGFVRDLEAAYVAMAEGSPKLSAPADFG
jgi:predicted O-linked N-acetylglucosamine transferase (SPINDLY family)